MTAWWRSEWRQTFARKGTQDTTVSMYRNWRRPFDGNSGFCNKQNAGGFDTQVCQRICASIGLEFFVSQHSLCGVLVRCKTNIFDSCHFTDECTMPGTFILKILCYIALNIILYLRSTWTLSHYSVLNSIVLSVEEGRISCVLSNVRFVKYKGRMSWDAEKFGTFEVVTICMLI
jgi:hypothetical protein